MSTDTVLTDEQVGDLYQDWHCFFKDNPGGAALCVRAIEQAVLQSPEVQALRKDAERYRWLRTDDIGTEIVVEDMYESALCGEDLDAAIDVAMGDQK